MSRINRRTLLKVVGVSAASAMAGCSNSLPGKRRPNCIAIIADDLGYADIGVHGCTDFQTPHIDSIAYNGVRFTNAYAGASVCSPSRACIMTGRFPCTFGYMYNPFSAPDSYGLPVTETTLGDVMRAGGYKTGLIGKWHLGNKPEFLPNNRGFDEFYGFPDGPQMYHAPAADDPKVRAGFKLHRNAQPVTTKEYITDAFTREACAFIEAHYQERFCLVVAHQAPHVPLAATERYLNGVAHIADPARRFYAAAIAAMDAGIGLIVQSLKRLGIYEDTILMFFSDNGGSSNELPVNNGSLRGDKAKLFEGGIRVPLMMQWPRTLESGRTFDDAVSLADVLPTFAAAAGITPTVQKPLHGTDVIPYVRGQMSGKPHQSLYWAQGGDAAIRRDEWKYIRNAKFGNPQLYNLAHDQAESRNVASEYPAIASELSAEIESWVKALPAPLWGWSSNNTWNSSTQATTEPTSRPSS